MRTRIAKIRLKDQLIQDITLPYGSDFLSVDGEGVDVILYYSFPALVPQAEVEERKIMISYMGLEFEYKPIEDVYLGQHRGIFIFDITDRE